ncbi:ExeM/NucH family extracellular endonuclease [Propionibacteriaceae bacterium Y1923]
MPVTLSRLRVVAATAVAGALAATGIMATTSTTAAAANGQLIINEVYGGGGNSGATYTHDFIELYNPSNTPVNLNGYQLEYFASNGNSGGVCNLDGKTVPANSYFLVQQGAGAGGSTPLPSPDHTCSLNMAANNGAVQLRNAAGEVDLVGYGPSASRYETSPTATTANATSASRTNFVDTDNNNLDFTIGSATPQNSGGTTPTDPPTEPGDITPIAQIQGTGASTPLNGQRITTVGVVTATYPTGGFNGFYIQTPGSGGQAKSAGDASDGIFVFTQTAPSVTIGDCVNVTGTAGEFSGLTQLSGTPVITTATGCAPVVPTELDTLPATDAAKEVYEGMLVLPKGNYTITNNYQLNQFGQLGLAFGDEPLYQATDVVPYQQAVAYENAQLTKWITLDDGSSWNYLTNNTAKETPLPYLSQATPMRTNSQLSFTKPVILDYRFQWNFQPTGQVVGASVDFLTSENDRPTTVPDVGGDIQIANFNVLNYFTSLGQDEAGCQPYRDREGNPVAANNCQVRGAFTQSAFEDQQAKIVAAINGMDAEVVGLMEIENSANFGQHRDYTLSKLVDALNADDPTKNWAFVPTNPGQVPPNEDNIRLAFIYRADAVTPVDGSQILTDPAFANARQPLAQKFQVTGTDVEFVVIANHFKSKGSGPDDGTGQGLSNASRKEQATALANWADTVFGDEAVFLTGDFNAYTMEEPMQILYDAGYANVLTEWQATYQFSGRLGSLDHIVANAAAQALISDAKVWEINGDEAISLQYSRRNYNITDFHADNEFASSDHDPVVVGINAAEATEAPAVTTQPQAAQAEIGDDVSFTAAASGEPAPTVQWQSSTDGTTWTDLAGETSTTLTLTGVTLAQDGTRYRAVFTNSTGSVETTAVTLTVVDNTPRPTYPASNAFGDHDGDGVADIYVVTSNGHLELWKGSATQATLLGTRGTVLANVVTVSQIGDWNGDRRSDVLVRAADNNLWIYTSDESGGLAPWRQVGRNWQNMDIVTYVGSLDGSANRYVVARSQADNRLYRYTMSATGLTGATVIGQNWQGMSSLFSVGDFNGDGLSDLMGIRASDGTLWLYLGQRDGKIGYARQVGRGWSTFKAAFSPGDLNRDGRFDLVGVRNDGVMFGYTNNGAGGWSGARQLASGFETDKLFA